MIVRHRFFAGTHLSHPLHC